MSKPEKDRRIIISCGRAEMLAFDKLLKETSKSYIIDYCEYCKQSGHKDTECPIRLNELMG